MKKIPLVPNYFLIIPLALLLFNTTVNAQEEHDIKLTILKNGFSLSFEWLITSRSSLSIGAEIYRKEDPDHQPSYSDNGRGLSFAYRFYMLRRNKILNGLYLSPNFSFQDHEIIYGRARNRDFAFLGLALVPAYAESINRLSVLSKGIKIGYQLKLRSVILDTGVNFSWQQTSVKENQIVLDDGSIRELKPEINGFSPLPYLGLGFSF